MPIKTNNFDRFRRAVKAEQKKRLELAARVVANRAKELLSVSGTGVRTKAGVVRAVKRTRKTIYGAFPSAPGDPPHKQTGRLRGSVTQEIVDGLKLVARVGTNVPYGRLLELFVGPRPWLVRSLKESHSRIAAILTMPWKWSG